MDKHYLDLLGNIQVALDKNSHLYFKIYKMYVANSASNVRSIKNFRQDAELNKLSYSRFDDIANSYLTMDRYPDLKFDEFMIVRSIILYNLKILGFNNSFLNVGQLESELIKNIKLFMIRLKNFTKSNSKPIGSILDSNFHDGVYAILGTPKSGKQLVNNFLIDELVKSKNSKDILHIACGERGDVLFKDKKQNFNLSKRLVNKLIEVIIMDDLLELIKVIINSSSEYIFVNSINTILSNIDSKAVVKGGIDKMGLENVLLLLNAIGEALNKKIFVTLRVTENEIENHIQSIVDGVSWGYFMINESQLVFHNRDSSQLRDQRVSRKIITDNMTEIIKVI